MLRKILSKVWPLDRGEPLNQFSGLLDAQGNRLMVTVQSEPIGFVVFAGRTK